MESANDVVSSPNTGLKYPVGFRFRPTDEELVVHYLKKKILRLPFPASVIPVFDVFRLNPSNLPGNVCEKRYFFCNKKKGKDVITVKQRASLNSSYWKPIGKDRLIFASAEPNRVVGLRRTMVFCQGNRFSDTNTRWIMHEYHLIHLIPSLESNEHWVACAVFQKRRRFKRKQARRTTDSKSEENSKKL